MKIDKPEENSTVLISNEDVLEHVREWLIEHIFRNGYVMHSDEIRGVRDPGFNPDIDLAEVISGLYELLHMVIMDERYDYMFHWANKCGAWVESDFFLKMIKDWVKEGKHETHS